MRKYPTRIKPTPTILWNKGVLKILDQTKLPEVEEYIETTDFREVIVAIKRLSIRGAPALGCTGAYACALSAYKCNSLLKESFKRLVLNDWDKIANARPTAVNLKWAVDIMKKQLEDYLENTDWETVFHFFFKISGFCFIVCSVISSFILVVDHSCDLVVYIISGGRSSPVNDLPI